MKFADIAAWPFDVLAVRIGSFVRLCARVERFPPAASRFAAPAPAAVGTSSMLGGFAALIAESFARFGGYAGLRFDAFRKSSSVGYWLYEKPGLGFPDRVKIFIAALISGSGPE